MKAFESPHPTCQHRRLETFDVDLQQVEAPQATVIHQLIECSDLDRRGLDLGARLVNSGHRRRPSRNERSRGVPRRIDQRGRASLCPEGDFHHLDVGQPIELKRAAQVLGRAMTGLDRNHTTAMGDECVRQCAETKICADVDYDRVDGCHRLRYPNRRGQRVGGQVIKILVMW